MSYKDQMPIIIMGKNIDGGLPSDGQILRFNAASNLWKLASVASAPFGDLLDATNFNDVVTASVQAGDLMYGNGTPKWDRLPKGTNGYLLAMVAGLPAWLSFGASSGYLKGGNPPTIQTGIPLADLLNAGGASGDIPYWDGSNWVRLAKGANGQFLTLSGGLPAWATGPSAATTQKAVVGATFTTTSATFVDITGLSITLPNTGHKALVNVILTQSNNALNEESDFQVLNNGVAVDNPVRNKQAVASDKSVITFSVVVTASGQVVKVQAQTTGSTLSVFGTTAGYMSKIETLET